MAHTLIYIVCIQQRSSLSLVGSRLPHLVDKDVSPSAQTELLRSQSCGFGSVGEEQGKGTGKGRGKGKFGIGRMQGLPRNVQSCQYQGTHSHVSLWHCSFLHFREHLLKLDLLFSLQNCPSPSFRFSCGIGETGRSMNTSSIPSKVFLDFAFHSWEFIFLSATSGFHLHSENIPS